MNVLILYAHPSPLSFNAALKDAAADEAKLLGHAVQISDLYADNFQAVGGAADFVAPKHPDLFHYQSEQRAAALGSGFTPDIAREQDKLRWADCLIMQFPLWWGGPPAIVKGWLDRVCAYGVAYADGTRYASGLFRGRRSLVSVTTGGSRHRFSDEGGYGDIDAVLWPIQRLFLDYMGYNTVPPHVCYGAPRIDDVARAQHIEGLRRRVRGMLSKDIDAAPIPSSETLLAKVGERSWNSAV